MRNIKIVCSLLVVLAFACQTDDPSFGPVVAPTNLQLNVEVANDQSGNVTITPTANDAVNFHVIFMEGADPVVVTDGEQATFRYTQSGQYEQSITVIAYGTGGASSSEVVVVDLDVRLVIDAEKLAMLAGKANEGKRWVWDASNAGHFGVGDPLENFPNFFSAGPNSLNPCLYDDVLVFSHDGQDNYTYELETAGAIYINWAEVKRFFPDATPQQFVDECRDLTGQVDFVTDFVVIEDTTTGTSNLTVTNSVLSYWAGIPDYEIIELTNNKLVVRGLQDPFDPPGAQLAWYHTFVPEDGGGGGGGQPMCDSYTGDTGSGNNDRLIWADEFNQDGLPCGDNWTYEQGANGWGNNELQYYTDRPDNAIVENGVLKITAKREDFSGAEYTSARLISKNNFEFQYGRVEVRAKLPTGGGTWPAIWMLGADIDTNPWPGAGEMDIMEHVGNNQDRILSTIHFPGNSGADGIGDSLVVPSVSDQFYTYSVNWTENLIQFAVDETIIFTYGNSASVPFNKDFFMILNVAIGGDLGGDVDPAFTESALEIDYVRVYQ